MIMNISKKVLALIEKSNLNKDQFLQFCKIEKMTQEEINNVDYMEERIETWSEYL